MLRLNSVQFFSIPTMLVSYDCGIKFDVYLRKGKNFFLFAKHGELTDSHKARLTDNNVEALYIHTDDVPNYDEYIEENFSNLIQDDSIPLDDRSKMLLDYSLGISKALMQSEGKIIPSPDSKEKVENIAAQTYEYIARKKGAVKSISRFLSHHYRTYSHCVNVSVYVLFALSSLGVDRHTAKLVGAGATLHDIGKAKVPKKILNKPGRLTDEEREVINKHPADGLDICRDMGLDHLSKECIIHHHEKLDGSGYPAQARTIPEYVRLVTIADIYDALTTDRAYSKAYDAFRAIKIINQDAEAGRLDKKLCGEFIKILTEGQIIAD